jgi:peptidyl-prolyl cis-trans isomerase C
MKRSIIGIFVLAVLFGASGCKMSGDVLATYTGGKITRGEFYEWLDARKMAKDAIIKKKSEQKNNLERFATEKLVVQEAMKAGYDKKDDFVFLKNLATRGFYAQYLGKLISSEGKFSEDAAKARIIKLTIKNYKIDKNNRQKLSDVELEAAFKEKTDKARSIIDELKKGASFDDLAKKYSDDFSKRKGGDIGYIIQGMRGEDFSKAVFAVKKGEYTMEPVRIGNAVYIIKVEDREKVTESNIESIIEDKNQQMGLKRRLMYNSSIRLQDSLMKSKDVVNNIDMVSFYDPAALIYKVGAVEFKVSDLNKLVDFIMGKRRKMGRADMPVDEKMKRELAKRFLREEVMRREAVRRGIDKEEKFKTELKYFIDYNLAGTYESEVVLTNITVTPQDVRDYYNKNLDRMYTRNINEGGKNVKKVISFEEARPNIERRMQDIKRSEKRKTWVEELLNKNKYKIDESELAGK